MKNNFKSKYKQLIKYYKKNLLKSHKNSFNNITNSLNYFILNLMLLRDYYVLTETDLNPETNLKLASICAAVSEYENYNNCFNLYYTVENGVPKIKDLTKTKEEIDVEYNTARLQHWTAFWNIVALNIEGWE